MRVPFRRSLLTGGVAAARVVLARPARPTRAPATPYQMPFPCGQEWTGTTRASHSPSRNAIDWNRPTTRATRSSPPRPGVVTRGRARAAATGGLVRVDHGDGETSVYAHLASVAVAVGQARRPGQPWSAPSASTGNATGAAPALRGAQRRRHVVAPCFDGVTFVFGSTPASRNCVDVPRRRRLHRRPQVGGRGLPPARRWRRSGSLGRPRKPR